MTPRLSAGMQARLTTNLHLREAAGLEGSPPAIAGLMPAAKALAAVVAARGRRGVTLLVAPTRIVLNGSRGTEIVLSNIGDETATYRISVGKRHKVEPRQIVGAIANEGGLSRQDFGHIDILGDHSLVELPADVGALAISD